jgi:predicted nucleic acid-binding protein
VCVDAGLVGQIVLPDERSPVAETLWAGWIEQGVTICGPPLLYAEVASTIRRAVVRGQFSADAGEVVFQHFLSLGIARIDRDDLYPRAWELARRYNQPRVYDML